MPTTLKDEAAIVGIGQTEFSKNSGRSELQLASEAVRAACVEFVLAGLYVTDRISRSQQHGRITYEIS